MKQHFRKPDHVFIELTNHCNMHCSFCPSDELAKPRALAPPDRVESFIRETHRLGIDRPIHFNVLGEPLLNKRIFDHIVLCEELGLKVILVTNISILTGERLQRVFRHNNVVLVLSLQTPTEKSFEIRRYPLISFERYMRIVGDCIREKFRSGSQSSIEIHVSSELGNHANFHRERPGSLWQIFDSDEERTTWFTNYVGELQAMSSALASEFSEFFADEHVRALAEHSCQFADGTISESPERLLAQPAGVPETEFWGWMFAPDCYLRIKQFGLWGMQQPFLEKHLHPGEMVFVEERTEPFECPMATSLTMLADGTLSLCCVDYEGEMSVGKYGVDALEGVLRSNERRSMLENAMVNPLCRRCQGNAFVFDTKGAEAGNVTPVYGAGWYGLEQDLGGRPGRWSNGKGRCYFYARSSVRSISFEFRSLFSGETEIELVLAKRVGDTDAFEEIQSDRIKAKDNRTIAQSISVDLMAGGLYRLEFRSPTFRPCELDGSPDQRALGIAMYSISASREKGLASVASEGNQVRAKCNAAQIKRNASIAERDAAIADRDVVNAELAAAKATSLRRITAPIRRFVQTIRR